MTRTKHRGCPVAPTVSTIIAVALLPIAALLVMSGCRSSSVEAPQSAVTPPAEPLRATGEAVEQINGRLIIFNAASLNRCFNQLEKAFEDRFPQVDVVRESGGSRDQCRKVTQLQREADIIASADYGLIPDMLMPDHAEWAIAFARNRMVIAYTDKSKHAREINADNWYEVLLREGVRFGYADPDKAPVGYRTLMVWQLADQCYKDRPGGKCICESLKRACPPSNIRPDVEQLVPLVESLDLDYVFVYRNVALEHNLQWLKLPDEIDLSSEEFADSYRQATVEVSGKAPGETVTKVGNPCIYGVTIVNDAPNEPAAVEFVKFLLGPEGQKIVESCFVEPVVPALCPTPEFLPGPLQDMIEKGEV